MKQLPPFDKYEYYLRAVQDPEPTVDFIEMVYKRSYKKEALSLGEDFCGTFALSCAWVERGSGKTAAAVDISKEPIRYGLKNYYSELKGEERKRLKIYQSDVRHKNLPKVDILCAFNFSFFIFKRRKVLLEYFKNCHQRLNHKGLLIVDSFGGSETQGATLDVIKHRGFTYYWDQVSFDPITHEARFYIHFKRNGEKKRQRVFHYDWRLWSLPEIKDLLHDAGFKKTQVYWEGTSRNGTGNGIFKKKQNEKNCEGWYAYITACK